MSRYEYKVVPAPNRGLKAKGIKGPEARFSHGLEVLMNDLGAQGWEYLRAETLPSVERVGLTGITTEWRNVLVFRRPRENDAEAVAPELLPAPTPADLADVQMTQDTAKDRPSADLPQENAARTVETTTDNGVEDTGNAREVGTSLSTLAAARNTSKSID